MNPKELFRSRRQERETKAADYAEKLARQRQTKINKYMDMTAEELKQEAIAALSSADLAFRHSDVQASAYFGRARVISELAALAEQREKGLIPRLATRGRQVGVSASGYHYQAVEQFVYADEALRCSNVDSVSFYEKATVLCMLAALDERQPGNVLAGAASIIFENLGVTRLT